MAALLLAAALAGCSNLKEVRDYASESARFAAYTELTTRFRDTYEREQPYLTPAAQSLAKENDARRLAAYRDLVAIHRAVTLYMQTLARLAGEDSFDLSQEIGAVGSAIKAYPALGISKKHADAATGITRIAMKWAGAGYQEQAIKQMVREGEPHLQVTLDGMLALVRYYRKTNENEEKTVLGFLEVEIPFAESAGNRLLAALGRAHAQAKTSEYDSARKQYGAAERGLKRIAEGHTRLLNNLGTLSRDEIRSSLGAIARDIKATREDIATVR